MRINNKLAMAVAVALYSLSATDIVFAGALVNLDTDGSAAALATFTVSDSAGTGAVPTDFVSSIPTSVITDESGVIYASELFGTSPASLPSTTSAGVIYTVDGVINKSFYLTFTLSGNATFSDGAKLYTTDSTGLFDEDGATFLPASPMVVTGGSSSQVKFNIGVDTATPLIANAKFLLKYKLGNAGATLSVPNSTIKMSVTATSQGPDPYTVTVADDVIVAQSVQAVEVKVNPVTFVNAKISTALESTEFSETLTAVSGVQDAAFITTTQALLGSIVITHDVTAMNEDGATMFELGASSGGGQVTAATINISEGQFAASVETPGGVKLIDDAELDLRAITEISEDGTGATIDIKDVLGGMIDILDLDGGGDDDDFEKTTDLRLVVDGVTGINIPENAPCATLTIDYTGTNIVDVEIPTDGGCITLPKIQQDGTVCWVNIIPKVTAATDILSILITNNGVIDGELIGTMYAQDGSVLFTAKNLADSTGNTTLEAGKTMRLTPVDLGMLMDGATTGNPGTWDGRSVLKISTVIPDIEILSLMRDLNSNINSNISQGAAGASCTSD